MADVVSCVNLTKDYGGKLALDHVNLKLQSGRIIGLLGPNGSGKTTLLKLLMGLLTPTEGTATIKGHAPGVETKKVVSYLPERTALSNWMRVKDALAMYQDFFADFDRTKALDMLQSLGIDLTHKFSTMSKGTKEKLQLSLVMSRNADLYLLDEPIAGVDPAARDYILNTIITHYNKDAAVVISTHLIYDIERVLHDVIFLNEGKVTVFATVEQLRQVQGKSVDEYFREVFRC